MAKLRCRDLEQVHYGHDFWGVQKRVAEEGGAGTSAGAARGALGCLLRNATMIRMPVPRGIGPFCCGANNAIMKTPHEEEMTMGGIVNQVDAETRRQEKE